jgi:predicted Zn-dependent protease
MKEFDYDMINRYLDGEMNAEELKAFELLMQQDVDLQKEVELTKDVLSTLTIKLQPGENEKALQHSLTEMNTEYFSTKTQQAKIISVNRRRWMTAVAAIFIMALLLTLWQPWKKEDLFQQYAAIQMPGIAERGAATDSLLKQAVENFNNKKFAEAIPAFEKILRDSAENSFVQYYYAIALLQNDNIKKARVQFSALYNGASIFKNDAAFYMALSYLKENNILVCKDWLNKIPADNATWFKAQELLKKL